MPFISPFSNDDPTVPRTLDWLIPGQMRGAFMFSDPTLASTLSFSIAPSNLTGLMISGFVGDDNFDDDIFSLESLEVPLQQVAPSKRWLSVFLMPRERAGKSFDFFLSFFSDDTAFPNQEYEFKSEGKPIGVRIPVKFLR